MKPVWNRTWLPFTCGLLGVLVGAAIVRAPATLAQADEADEPKTTVVGEITVTTGKFGGPAITIKPDGIRMWSGDGVRMSTITSSAIELVDHKDRRLWMNTDFRGNGGFVVLDKKGLPRAMLYGESSGEGVLRLQGNDGTNRAELRERKGAGGRFQLSNGFGSPEVKLPAD